VVSPKGLQETILVPATLVGAPVLIDGLRFTLRDHHPQLGWLLDDGAGHMLGLSDPEIHGLRKASRLRLPADGASRADLKTFMPREQRASMLADLPGWHLHASDRDHLGPHNLLVWRDPLGGPAAGRAWLLTAAAPGSGVVVATKVEIAGELADENAA
jgi:hypothetical protein